MIREELLHVLKELVALYRSGELSETEFQETKKLLLAQMQREEKAPEHVPAPVEPSALEIEELLAPLSSPSQQGAPPTTQDQDPRPRPSSQEEIEDLQNTLRDLRSAFTMGNLSPAEFQAGERVLRERLRDVVQEGRQPAAPQPPGAQGKRWSSLPMLHGMSSFSPSPQAHKLLSAGQLLLGRYYLERLLGQGGMGQVFLCYDTIRQDRYALKLIHPHLAQYEELRARFLQELKANERLTHPGIVRTYALEQDAASGFLFFTMEFVEGVTLDTVLQTAADQRQSPPLPLQVTMRILAELITVLSYAHAQGVIHRDLKPSNIMVTDLGHIKLMDFGIAKILEGSAINKHTGFGGFVYYMAPEQLQGGGRVTPAVDVFSLGVITYQMLTGEVPMGAVLAPSRIVPSLPREVDAIVLGALAPRPSERPATPVAFWNALYKTLYPYLPREAEGTPWGSFGTAFSKSPNAQNAKPDASELERIVMASRPNVPDPPQQEKANPENNSHLGDLLQTRELPADKLPPPSRKKRSNRTLSASSHLQRLHRNRPPGGHLNPQNTPARSRDLEGKNPRNLGPGSGFSRLEDEAHGEEMISLQKANSQQKTPREDNPTPIASSIPVEELLTPREITIDKNPHFFGEARFLSTLSPNSQRTALDLPDPPQSLQLDFLYAHDKTPLLQLVHIPAGTFLMGSRQNDLLAYPNEKPQRHVSLDAYWISRTPITNRVWLKFVQESGYSNPNPLYLQHWHNKKPPKILMEHPVVYVSYEDLEHFCLFYKVLIPTEAQWEKAARGTEGQVWPWGNQKPHADLCNFLGAGIDTTTPVAMYAAGMGPYGMLDCSGNVWEWCADHWSLEWLEQMGEQASNPVHRSQGDKSLPVRHSIRGGCFRYHGRGVRCAFRFFSESPSEMLGARIVRTSQVAGTQREKSQAESDTKKPQDKDP